MTYEIRRPNDDDRSQLDDLLIEDYGKLHIPKQPLTDKQMNRYAKEAWAAFNQDNIPEALTLADDWRYGDAAPYSHLAMPVLKLLGKYARFYSGQTGIFVLSATNYEDDGPLGTLVDATEVLEPKTGAVHVPLIKTEEEAQAFLVGRGFQTSSRAREYVFGLDEPVETVLMTRKD